MLCGVFPEVEGAIPALTVDKAPLAPQTRYSVAVSLSFCLCLSPCLLSFAVSLSACLSLSLCQVSLSLSLSVCVPPFLFVCLSVFLCLSISLCFSVSNGRSVWMCTWCVSICIECVCRTSLRHSVGLKSSYSHLLMPDGRAEITTCHSRTAMTVDYILYTPGTHTHTLSYSKTYQHTRGNINIDILNYKPLYTHMDTIIYSQSVPKSSLYLPYPSSCFMLILPSQGSTTSSLPCGRGLQLLARLSLVGHSELKAVSGLPNQHHSSDHLPILARFRLRR